MNRGKLVFTTLISVLFLYLFIWSPHFRHLFSGEEPFLVALFGHPRIDWGSLIRILSEVHLRYVLSAVLVLMGSEFIRTWRWQILLSPVQKVSFHTMFGFLNIGYMANNILPMRLGEVLRAYMLGDYQHISRVSVLATIVIERLLDMLALVALVGLSLFLYRFPPGTISPTAATMMGGAALLLAGVILLMLVYRRLTLWIIDRLTAFLPGRWREKIVNMAQSFLDGMEIMRSTHHFGRLLLSSVSLWVCYLIITLLTFLAFDLQSGDYPQLSGQFVTAGIVVLTITTVGFAIPSAPGAIGTYHAAGQFAMSLFGVPALVAVPFAIVLHLVNFILTTTLGFVYLWKFQLNFHVMRHEIKRGKS